jgi:hypothetical protein
MTNRDLSEPGRRGPGLALATLLAVVLGALAPAAAQARPPRISEPPAIDGTAQVGSTLTAQGARWDGKPEPTATWQWYRCDSPNGGTRACQAIQGATGTSYTVGPADLGTYLRVVLIVRNEDGWAWASSAPTAAVEPAPPAPDPEPEPSPSPLPDPTPPPVPRETTGPVPADTVEVRGEAEALRKMSPAPVVRIRGRLTRSGARITLLTVRAPRGARIALRCFGRGCPARRWAGTASLTRIARFQGPLPAGTRLVVSVTKPGRIGKHTTIVIRRGAAPTRRDRCLMPSARKPVRCPAA